MSIRCVCPNGHILKADDALAGRAALCPACKSRVTVPRPAASDVSEDVIMDMLGADPPAEGSDAKSGFRRLDGPQSTSSSGILSKAHKRCDRCHREVFDKVHICPHCHAYIASLRDF
ncbi:MAG: hypothetical protein ABFC63_02265 [Thermoguttaceae bacterium]